MSRPTIVSKYVPSKDFKKLVEDLEAINNEVNAETFNW